MFSLIIGMLNFIILMLIIAVAANAGKILGVVATPIGILFLLLIAAIGVVQYLNRSISNTKTRNAFGIVAVINSLVIILFLITSL